MCGRCDGLLRIPEIHIAGPDGDVDDWIQRIDLERTTIQCEGFLGVALIELEYRVHDSKDTVRGILLQRGRESLLRELDIAVIPRQLPAECEQTRIVRRQTQAATNNLAQPFSVLCHGDPHVDDLQDVRHTETVVSLE